MNTRRNTTEVDTLKRELEDEMLRRFGPVLGSGVLHRALGYPSAAAFRQAALRGTVTVPLFEIPKRRGRFALTRDVASWLAERRASALPASTLTPSTSR